MKFMKIFILFAMLTSFVYPTIGVASALEKLPSSEDSDQWEIMIDNPKSEDVEPKPDVYNVYSMDVKYIGDEGIKLESVEVYRDDPDSSYDFELFTVADLDDLEVEKNGKQPFFSHQNFPVSIQAKELKVIVTWTNKDNSGRKYREEFIFKQ